MKCFVIRYQFKQGSPEQWHEQVAGFIAALDGDPQLAGRLSYRVMKEKDGLGYYHLVVAEDDVPGILQGKDFFKPYTEGTRRVGGGEVTVTPLEIVGQTAYRG